MRRSIPVGFLLAAAAVLVGGCGAQSLQTSKPPKTISPAQSTVIFDCGGTAHVEPASLVLACGDAGLEVARLHWRGWGGAGASANGSLIAETCVPSCVAGGTKTYPVALVASGLGLEGTHVAYRQLEAISLGGSIPGYGRDLRYSLSATGPALVEPVPAVARTTRTTRALAVQATTEAAQTGSRTQPSPARPKAKASK